MPDELLMRQVPQDLTAEQSLLGAMLVDPNCIPEVIEQVRADDFYAEENKRIFETIYSMFNGAQRIDPVTVLDMLTRMGYYDEAGGRAYLFQLMEVTPGARNVNEYVRIVRDKSLLRQLADAGSEIQQNALEAHGEASGIAELAEQRIYSIRQGREIKGLSRLSEVIADLYTELDERARSDSEIPGMSTGFHALDTALTGLNKSDLILIAARPGMGKTAFALNVALNAAKASVKNKERGDKKGTGVCVFQLEMGKEQLASRFLSSEALIESQKLKTGNLDGDDWVKIARASGVLAGLNIYVDDNPAITVAEIKAKCRRLGDELGLIVIDYLQLMHVGGRHMDNRVQEVAEISRSCVCRSCRVRPSSARISARCCPTCESPARSSRTLTSLCLSTAMIITMTRARTKISQKLSLRKTVTVRPAPLSCSGSVSTRPSPTRTAFTRSKPCWIR